MKNIRLEPYTIEDARVRYEAIIESQDHLLPWIPYVADYTLEKSEAWVKNSIKEFAAGTEYGFKIIDAEQKYLGEVRLISITINIWERFANIVLWIRKSCTHQGVATEAIKLIKFFAFDELKLYRLQYIVLPDNERSIALALKIGAMREGQLRSQWCFNGEMKHPLLFSLIPEV